MTRSRTFPGCGFAILLLALIFIVPAIIAGGFSMMHRNGSVSVAPASNANGTSIVNGEITIASDEVINRNVNAVNSRVTINGVVNGNVTLVNSATDIYGTVNGDIVAVNSPITLYPKAVVNKITGTNSPVDLRQGAIVRSNTPDFVKPATQSGPPAPPANIPGNRVEHEPRMGWFNPFSGFMGYLALAGLSVLIASLFPRQFNRAEGVLRSNPKRVGLLGLLSFIAAIPLSVLLGILIISIPLIPVLWILIGAGMVFGFAVIVKVVGERLLQAFNLRSVSITPITAIGAGALVLWLVSLVPVFGGITIAIVWTIALGLAMMTRLGTRSNLGWLNPAWSSYGATPAAAATPATNNGNGNGDLRYSPVQPGPSPYVRPGQTPTTEPPVTEPPVAGSNPSWSAPDTTRLPDEPPSEPEKL